MKWVLVLYVLFCSFALAKKTSTLRKDCAVFAEPSADSKINCEELKGAEVRVGKEAGEVWDRYVYIKSGECKGFVSEECLRKTKKRKKKNQKKNRKNRVEKNLNDRTARLRKEKQVTDDKEYTKLGLAATLDGNAATIANSSTITRGIGFSFGVRLSVPFSKKLRLNTKLSYKQLSLTREIGTSGGVTFSADLFKIKQNNKYAAASVLLGYRVVRAKTMGKVTGWLEGGAEFLYAFAGTQSTQVQSGTTSNGSGTFSEVSSQSYRPEDNLLLALFGVSVDFLVSEKFSLLSGLHLFANTAGRDGNRLFGLRLGFAGQIVL